MDVEPSDTEELTEETIRNNGFFQILKVRMEKGYWSAYTSSLEDTAAENNDFEGEDLADSVNLVLTDPQYNTRRNQIRDNSANDMITV